MLFFTLSFCNAIKNMSKRKKEEIHFCGKRKKKNQNGVIIMISVGGKETVFMWIVWIKILKKENSKKYLIFENI